MFGLLSVAFCAFALAQAGVKKPRLVATEPQAQASHGIEVSEHSGPGGYYEGHSGSGQDKYSTAAELTSLAHSSAIQAKTAVQNQHTAGSQAAFGAKSSLASTAVGAALTAQAALVGKQVIVQGLKKQLGEAEHQLQAEIGQYHQAENAAAAVAEAAQQAQATLNALTGAAAAAQGSAAHASKAATQAAAAAAAQHSMVVSAKQRLAHISEQLHNALAELHETEASAQKALTAAHIAQSNAAAAGAAVVTASQSGGHEQGHHEGSYH